MSKSKAEVAKDLYNEFIREIGEVAIAGDDESDVRNESVKHLLTARSKFESLMRLLKDTERSGSTLPSIVGDASADSKYSTPTTDVKSVTSHSSKLETCIEKLSTAFELLTTKGTRPVAGSGYGGAAGSGAMQVLLKSMDMKMWRGEEHEPWENVEARVIDAAEAVECEEALYTDYQAMIDEKDDDEEGIEEKTIEEWKAKSDAALYIIKRIFSGKGKAFNIVNKHKKKSGRNTWAYSVWTELRMGFDAEGVHDRKELQLKYREACKFKERINPVDQITEVETWVYKLRQCGVKIDEDTIIYDILGGLPDCYDIVGQSIEEAMEDESTKPTIRK